MLAACETAFASRATPGAHLADARCIDVAKGGEGMGGAACACLPGPSRSHIAHVHKVAGGAESRPGGSRPRAIWRATVVRRVILVVLLVVLVFLVILLVCAVAGHGRFRHGKHSDPPPRLRKRTCQLSRRLHNARQRAGAAPSMPKTGCERLCGVLELRQRGRRGAEQELQPRRRIAVRHHHERACRPVNEAPHRGHIPAG
mmetsp:Transcript_4807/g.20597  ORF Transcript_4807/g.20597 Transcript_4807/m.20597 type:complete len:201 (-) Transcript_4807:478-1080(-)